MTSTALGPDVDVASLCPAIIIPALNEEPAIGRVIARIPYPASCVTVVDNGSTDRTAEIARAAGVHVVREPRRGYGRACLAGLREAYPSPIVVFLDADMSEDPADIPTLIHPIACGRADFVLSHRDGVGRPWHALAGTSLCVGAINVLWRSRFHDLGPLRAIQRDALDALNMTDNTWGWTIEMQVKAFEARLRILELPIVCQPRIGTSKISGTVNGTARAGVKMLTTIAHLWWTRGQRQSRGCFSME